MAFQDFVRYRRNQVPGWGNPLEQDTPLVMRVVTDNSGRGEKQVTGKGGDKIASGPEIQVEELRSVGRGSL